MPIINCIANFQTKIRDKNSIFYVAWTVFQGKSISSLLSFLSSLLFIRYIEKTDYGLYQLILSYFMFFQIFLSGFDASITRFLPTSRKRTQLQIIVTVLMLKFLILIPLLTVVECASLFSENFLDIPQDKLTTYNVLYLISLLNLPMSAVKTTLGSTMVGYQLYPQSMTVGAILAILNLVLVATIISLHLGITEYALFSVAVNLVGIWLTAAILQEHRRSFFMLLKRNCKISILKETFHKYIKSYSVPLNATSIMSYAKHHFPNIILGTRGDLEGVALFTILKNFFSLPHKQLDAFLEQLYPRLFRMAKDYRKSFETKFKLYVCYGFLARLIVALIMILGINIILAIYKIPSSKTSYLVACILIADFIIGYFLTVEKFIFMNARNTWSIAISSVFRSCISCLLSIILVRLYGVSGAAFAVLIGTGSSLFLLRYQRKEDYI